MGLYSGDYEGSADTSGRDICHQKKEYCPGVCFLGQAQCRGLGFYNSILCFRTKLDKSNFSGDWGCGSLVDSFVVWKDVCEIHEGITDSMEIGETLYVTSRRDFRKWLAKNCRKKEEIWLIFYKKYSGKPSISYDEAVEEALCYGWIDSQQKPIDAEKFARRFTPRKKGSNWAESNIKRAQRMLHSGKMTQAGMALLPVEVLKKLKNSIKN